MFFKIMVRDESGNWHQVTQIMREREAAETRFLIEKAYRDAGHNVTVETWEANRDE